MDLFERRKRLILYLEMKVEEQDWHGAADACMDLRELDILIKTRNQYGVRND